MTIRTSVNKYKSILKILEPEILEVYAQKASWRVFSYISGLNKITIK